MAILWRDDHDPRPPGPLASAVAWFLFVAGVVFVLGSLIGVWHE